jgi:hypothetical protein
MSILNFLREFQKNSLLENVNLNFYDVEEYILGRVLTQILSLINSIDSININSSSTDFDLFNTIYKDDNNNGNGNGRSSQVFRSCDLLSSSQLAMLKAMMAQTRILSFKLV